VWLKSPEEAGTYALVSIGVSALTTGFTSAMISFNMDVDVYRRNSQPHFYGFIPDEVSKKNEERSDEERKECYSTDHEERSDKERKELFSLASLARSPRCKKKNQKKSIRGYFHSLRSFARSLVRSFAHSPRRQQTLLLI